METFINKLRVVFADKVLRRRILFVFAALVIFRLLATIPVPGIDALKLEQFFANNQFLGLLNVFSGGGLSNLSIVMLGVGPYITASIIMQVLTILSPKLKAMYQEEGEAGRKRFAMYSRYLTIPLAVIQGLSFLILLERQGIITHLSYFGFAVNLIVITAGSVLLMWLGELISEFGIGNGVSLIIFSGIVARIPTTFQQLLYTFDPAQIPLYLGFLIAALAVISGVVMVTEAERPIPVTYAKRVRGNRISGSVSTYLPLRLNQAGVIPIIFALSILLMPQMVFSFLQHVSIPVVARVSEAILSFLSNNWFYSVLYFIFVVLFTYFYTAITFDPDQLSSNLQKNGAFIPGVRPGKSTALYVGKILTRITLVGAIFLGLVAVLPLIMRGITGITALAIGGTALLIVVSVVIDLLKKVDAQISMREY